MRACSSKRHNLLLHLPCQLSHIPLHASKERLNGMGITSGWEKRHSSFTYTLREWFVSFIPEPTQLTGVISCLGWPLRHELRLIRWQKWCWKFFMSLFCFVLFCARQALNETQIWRLYLLTQMSRSVWTPLLKSWHFCFLPSQEQSEYLTARAQLLFIPLTRPI